MGFGSYVSDLRITSRKTLRRFCVENGLEPVQWSKVERDVNHAPKDEAALSKLAKCFGLRPKTEEWNQFMEEARASRNASPTEYSDDKKILGLLPAFICGVEKTA